MSDCRRRGLDTLLAGGVYCTERIVVDGPGRRRGQHRIGVHQPSNWCAVEPGLDLLGRKPSVQVVAGDRVSLVAHRRTQDAFIPAEHRLAERIGQDLLAAGLRNLLILHSLLPYIGGTNYGSIKHSSFRATFFREISMANIDVPVEILEQFCTENRIKKLSLFGSVLREDFRQESDIDVLVEFEKNGVPGLLGISRMERELSQIFGGRKIDLRTPEDLSKYFRQQVLSTAEVQYAA